MLDKLLVSDILYAATSTGAEFAEVFVENNKKNSLGLINGKLERALSGIDFGIGIRIINKDRMVYVYTNKKDRESLINLAKNGATAIKGNSKQKQIVFNDLDYRKINNNNIEIYPSSIYSNKIVEIMKERALGGLNYSDKVFISNSECLEDAHMVGDAIEEVFLKMNGKVQYSNIGSTIGVHTGPGTVALFYWGEPR